jgi:hypothetical protein
LLLIQQLVALHDQHDLVVVHVVLEVARCHLRGLRCLECGDATAEIVLDLLQRLALCLGQVEVEEYCGCEWVLINFIAGLCVIFDGSPRIEINP